MQSISQDNNGMYLLSKNNTYNNHSERNTHGLPEIRSHHINSGYLQTESSRVVFMNNNSHIKLKQRKRGFHYSHRIGEQSVTDFFSNFKHLKKSIERDEHLKEP